jgi:hypothetical protein
MNDTFQLRPEPGIRTPDRVALAKCFDRELQADKMGSLVSWA